MARIFYRGETIPFEHTFFDSSGNVTAPTSAGVVVSYPTSASCYTGERETTTVTLIKNTTTQVWSGVLPTSQMYYGTVYWSIKSDDLTLAVSDGQFDLRANFANLEVK